ncbi:Rpn family recombination-promoting nuclease/putative transposase, partial [Streptomyces anulatus]|uniref:Rpn family recombination-promoting nuclease/putative transposase n=2 Tax=Actinomycetes TaxID=1760 RepID=UPI0036809C75
MGDSAAKPHDALFRHFIGQPSNAAAQARPVITSALAARIDWSSLALESISFVSRHLRGTYSDLLFSARFDGRDAYLYLLLEHQSSSDHFMSLRMLDYMVSIWNRYLRDHPKSKTLPLVIPIVVHASPDGKRWTAPTDVADLIDLGPDLRAAFDQHVPHLRFLLDDLTAATIDELYARPNIPETLALQVLLKTAPDNQRLDSDLKRLLPALMALVGDDLIAILTYIVSVGDTPDERLQ